MGSKLLFRFRSGTHGLNEELGRHNTRNNSKACFFVSECESVEHVLWECSEHSSICKEYIRNLDGFLQNDFHLKSSFDKTKYIFYQGIWECNGHLIIGNEGFFVWHMEFLQGKTLSFKFI